MKLSLEWYIDVRHIIGLELSANFTDWLMGTIASMVPCKSMVGGDFLLTWVIGDASL